MKLEIIGIDPSLRNWGLVKTEYDTQTKQLLVKDSLLVQPTKLTGKHRVNQADIHSAEQLYKASNSFIENAQAICIEVPTGSQSSRAMASYGICVGIIGSLKAKDIPIIQVTPLEVKKVIGNNQASKLEVINWVTNKHPEYNLPMQTKKGIKQIITSKAEHLADALVAIYASLNHTDFKKVSERYLSEN